MSSQPPSVNISTSIDGVDSVDKVENVDNTNNTSTEIITCSFNCSEQEVKRCRKCNRPYCILHTSRISPNFCKECFSQLEVIENKFSRTFDDYDVKKDQVILRKETCNRWYMDGPDWPFLNLWIDGLTDEELKMLWNFHYFIMKTIEHENDVRKIEKNRQLQSYKVPRLVSQTTTKKVAKVQTPETPEQLKTKWLKLGIPQATIDQMLQAMGVK